MRLLGILALIVLLSNPSGVISISVSTTSTSPGGIVPVSNENKTTYTPSFVGNGSVRDIGRISYITQTSGFSWNTTDTQSLSVGVPSLSMLRSNVSLAFPTFYKNSSLTQFRFFGFASTSSTSDYFVTLSFRPQGYSAKISIDGLVGNPTTLQIPLVPNGTQITYTLGASFLFAGNQEFSWSDIPLSYSPTFNNVTNLLSVILPSGSFHIDPLALDGTGHCNTGASNTCNVSLTTTNANDVIIVIQGCFSGGGCGGYSISDTSSLTWTLRLCRGSDGNTCASVNGFDTVAQYYTVATSTLSADSITCTQTGNVNGRISCIAFGISGATTGNCGSGGTTCFDSNAAVPCSADNGGATSTQFQCTLSTSNANDFLMGSSSSSTNNPASVSASGAFALSVCNGNQGGVADGDGAACNSYDIVSATQTSLTITHTATASEHWAFIGDAVKASGTTVSQGIQIFTANGASSATISVSGCAVTNSTFVADGFNHVYPALTSSCTVTLTQPTDGSCSTFVSTCTRYRWDISPKPKAATSITFSTCSSGTCTTYQNTTFYQLRNNYTETAFSPNKWDGTYKDACSNNQEVSQGFCQGYNSPTGTFVGFVVASGSTTDMCVLGAGLAIMTTNQGAQTGQCPTAGVFRGTMWADYNTQFCLPSQVGNTWFPVASSCFTDTTAGNSHSTNYSQSINTYGPSSFNWMLLIPFAIMPLPFVLVAAKRRRR